MRPAWFLIAVLSIFAPAASADDGGISAVGGAVRPLGRSVAVSMESEYVHARIRQDSASVECVFVLVNHGPATTISVGFPCASSGADADSSSARFDFFRSFVDGREVAVRVLPDSTHQAYGDFRTWWVKNVRFERGQRRTLCEVYSARPGSSLPNYRWFSYTLATGSTWRGPIGVGDVVFTLEGIAPDSVTDVSPPPTSRTPLELRWHFENLEPTLGSDYAVLSVGWNDPRTPWMYEFDREE